MLTLSCRGDSAAVLQIEQARVDAALFARVPARTEHALQMPDQVSA